MFAEIHVDSLAKVNGDWLAYSFTVALTDSDRLLFSNNRSPEVDKELF